MNDDVSKNFLTYLEAGEEFERECITLLERCGYKAWKCADAKARWDLEFNHNGQVYKVECKRDFAGEKTGNLFFETYFKSTPSGINNPQPHYWMHGIAPGHTLLFNRQQLVEFLQSAKRKGVAIMIDNVGDDKCSSGLLIQKRFIMECPGVKEM